jgi:chromate transporter
LLFVTETTTEVPAPGWLRPSLREAIPVWARIAALSFGGPAGQIAVMHEILVEEKNWVSERRFLHALNYAMLLPGPEAQQLATYVGWLLNRTVGGLVAGSLFILPGFLAILALSIFYALYGDVGIVAAVFFGLKAAVIAIVASAVYRVGRCTLVNRFLIGVAAVAFIAIFFFQVPFPWIIAGAAAVGYLVGQRRPDWFAAVSGHGEAQGDGADNGAPADRDYGPHTLPDTRRALLILTIGLLLWLGPLVILFLLPGSAPIFTELGVFFSKAAVVTFGGAYAVLAYVAQEAVMTFGWLQPGEMLVGLSMAETTPGPLIMVLEFVGFMAAFREPGGLGPLAAGILGAVWVTWVTFVPCFLWIFLGAPYMEKLRGNRHLAAALTTVTAAVVGVILNLAVWLAIHTPFAVVNDAQAGPLHVLAPDWRTANGASVAIAALAFIALFRYKVAMSLVLLGSALAGIAAFLVRGGL